MLNIFFGNYKGDNYIHNPKAFFDNAHEDAWLEDAWVKRMVADIDRSELVSPNLLLSPCSALFPLKGCPAASRH